MDARFHCSKRVRHTGRKSRHGVLETCAAVVQVLRMNPHYGLPLPRFQNLRKMRLQVPGLNAGKSGGYRLIYSIKEMDEALHIVFLEAYFKGDKEELSSGEYKDLEATATSVFAQPTLYEWE